MLGGAENVHVLLSGVAFEMIRAPVIETVDFIYETPHATFRINMPFAKIRFDLRLFMFN